MKHYIENLYIFILKAAITADKNDPILNEIMGHRYAKFFQFFRVFCSVNTLFSTRLLRMAYNIEEEIEILSLLFNHNDNADYSMEGIK